IVVSKARQVAEVMTYCKYQAYLLLAKLPPECSPTLRDVTAFSFALRLFAGRPVGTRVKMDPVKRDILALFDSDFRVLAPSGVLPSPQIDSNTYGYTASKMVVELEKHFVSN